MAVPKRKTSLQKKRSRRSHHALGRPNIRPCSNCGGYGIPHRICASCGFYKGKQILQPKVKKVKEKNQG